MNLPNRSKYNNKEEEMDTRYPQGTQDVFVGEPTPLLSKEDEGLLGKNFGDLPPNQEPSKDEQS